MDKSPIKKMQYVNTGEVCSGGSEILLNSGAIGSCVVVSAFDPVHTIGAMAHVMLPGTSPSNNHLNTTKYAANALAELLYQLKNRGAAIDTLEMCIAGGANVLKRKNDSIGNDNINSINNLLKLKNLKIKAQSIGGFERRTVLFDIELGCIYHTEGDSEQKILWQSTKSNNL